MTDRTTVANKNRRIRQEAERDRLRNQGHVGEVNRLLDILKDVPKFGDDQDPERVTEGTLLGPNEINRYRIALDNHHRMINKYIPDLKSVEISQEDDLANMSDEDLRDAIAAELAELE